MNDDAGEPFPGVAENLAWQFISLNLRRPVDRRPLSTQGYPQ
jgi:hypothetical protein